MHIQDAPGVNSLTELSSVEKAVLGAIFHKHAGQPFSTMMTTAECALESLSRAEAMMAFVVLRQKGWVEAVRKTWGERLYYIPATLIPLLTVTYAERVGCLVKPYLSDYHAGISKNNSIRSNEVKSDKVNLVREGKPDTAPELLHVMAWMVREGADQGLPLTNKGTLHKKMVQRLSKMTVLVPEDFEGLGIRYAHADVYPIQVAVILDLLLSLGLIVKEHNRLRVSHDHLYCWLSLSWSSMHREIYNVCMDRYGATEPRLQHFRYQLSTLGQTQNEWLGITAITSEVGGTEVAAESQEIGGSSDSPYVAHVRGWLHALAGLGYGEVGENAAGKPFFRWLIEPAALLGAGNDSLMDTNENAYYVQPDFEIMVPPDVTPQIRWNLEHCAELINRDRMSIYRITKERVLGAAEIGFTSDKMVRFLRLYSGTEMPEQVALAIQHWGREIDRSHMEAGQSQNTGQHNRGEEVGNLHTWLYEFRCESSEKLNLTVAEQMADESMVRLESKEELFYVNGRQGLVDSGLNLHAVDQDKSITEQSGLFPGYGEIPQMWHNEWRGYHMSTARQIAKKAIEWQTKLGLELDDDIVYVIPDQIHGHEDWTLTGWYISDAETNPAERRTFSPSEWNKIRLIIPNHAKT
ncbi:helicase-associated domain-containing protein [Paenibacillus sp. QZ-Y1]|uniref:helicase-associated domain-containing protein n=1 Tax=Paenibacillus sp. QZ-Y1 TaxID=3414511 RepID=UPI003F79F098